MNLTISRSEKIWI